MDMDFYEFILFLKYRSLEQQMFQIPHHTITDLLYFINGLQTIQTKFLHISSDLFSSTVHVLMKWSGNMTKHQPNCLLLFFVEGWLDEEIAFFCHVMKTQ